MAKIIRCLFSPAALSVLVSSLLYWIAAYYLKPHDLIELFDGVVIAMSLAVFVAYGARFRRGACEGRLTASDLVIAGIALGWFTQGIERAWRLASRVFDLGWMIEHPLIGYFLLLMVISSAMHLMVKGAVQGDAIGTGVAPRAWSAIVVTSFLGLALGTLAVVVNRALE